MAFLLILDNTSQHFDSNDGSHHEPVRLSMEAAPVLSI